jgi:hypothetical protein
MYIFEASQNAIQLQKEIQRGGKSMRGKQNGMWNNEEDERRRREGLRQYTERRRSYRTEMSGRMEIKRSTGDFDKGKELRKKIDDKKGEKGEKSRGVIREVYSKTKTR